MGLPPFPDDIPIAPIPRISLADLAADDAFATTRFFDACCDQGFCLLDLADSDNGLELLDEVEQAFRLGEEFFSLDQATKEDFKLSSGNVGYKPIGMTKLKNGKHDLTEICAVGRDSITTQQTTSIPQVFQRNRTQLQNTIHHVHSIAMLLLRVLASHLDVPFSVMESMHKTESATSTQLRFLHYPPQRRDSALEDRQQSLLGHTDSGSLTILFTKLGGLQVLPADADEDDESAWQWVRPEPGCAIINIGDPLVQWTNGALRSAFHRVLYAPGAQAGENRYSFGYFLKPADDAPMNCLNVGKVIPSDDAASLEEEIPPYKLWHQNKTKKIMQGHQQGVFRGGIRRSAKPMSIGHP